MGELIGEARDALGLELAIPITVLRPPEITSMNGHGDRVKELSDASQIGYNLSAPMVRLVGHPEGYGNVFPVLRALDDLRGWCRGRHLEPSTGPWEDHLDDVALETDTGAKLERPLCARLAWSVVIWRQTVPWSARIERIPRPVVTRLLGQALRHAWEQRREWAHGADSGVPEVLADLRRRRREAKQRVAAPPDMGVSCRYCGRPYDPASSEPCPKAADSREAAAAFAELYPDEAVLCAPAFPPKVPNEEISDSALDSAP